MEEEEEKEEEEEGERWEQMKCYSINILQIESDC